MLPGSLALASWAIERRGTARNSKNKKAGDQAFGRAVVTTLLLTEVHLYSRIINSGLQTNGFVLDGPGAVFFVCGSQRRNLGPRRAFSQASRPKKSGGGFGDHSSLNLGLRFGTTGSAAYSSGATQSVPTNDSFR